MAELFVAKHEDACQVIALLANVGITGGMHCGCPDRSEVCVRQRKGTAEYYEYKRKSDAGNKNIFYNCPNGTYFEVPDDRIDEAHAIYAKYLEDQVHWVTKLLKKCTNQFFKTFNFKWS